MARRHSTTAFGQLAEAIALVSHGNPGHIVDTLIAERGQRIVKNPLWPVMRPFLYTLLRYNKALQFANDVANMPGFQCFEYMSNLLKLDIQVRHAERIPETGGFILVSNHPTGIADGVAVFEIHTKLNSFAPEVLDVLEETLDRASHDFRALVLGNDDPRAFSAGADLAYILKLTLAPDSTELAAVADCSLV